MALNRDFPPHFPDQYKRYSGYWVGSTNFFGPQLWIESMATKEDLERAYQKDGHVIIRLYEQDLTASDDPYDTYHGLQFMEVGETYTNDDELGTINFSGSIDDPFSAWGRVGIWVWEYLPGVITAADFEVE